MESLRQEVPGLSRARELIDGLLGGGKLDMVLPAINEGNSKSAADVILAHVRMAGNNKAVIVGINRAGHSILNESDTPESLNEFAAILVTTSMEMAVEFGYYDQE